MKILENKNNMIILESEYYTYLISYNSVIAKVNNVLGGDYGLYLSTKWDYSQTTLKQLYNFIELYTTQRDEKGNMFTYALGLANNKHNYIMQQIENNNIKLIKEEEM